MDFCFGISVLFCHAKVDDMNEVGMFTSRSSDEKIIRFDIAINKILFMDYLDP